MLSRRGLPAVGSQPSASFPTGASCCCPHRASPWSRPGSCHSTPSASLHLFTPAPGDPASSLPTPRWALPPCSPSGCTAGVGRGCPAGDPRAWAPLCWGAAAPSRAPQLPASWCTWRVTPGLCLSLSVLNRSSERASSHPRLETGAATEAAAARSKGSQALAVLRSLQDARLLVFQPPP